MIASAMFGRGSQSVSRWGMVRFFAKPLFYSYNLYPRSGLEEMASPKKELLMLRIFRLTLPAALLVSLTWSTLLSDAARQAVFSALGANANVIIFVLGLFLIVGLYWLMGIYERKILYENRHVRPAF